MVHNESSVYDVMTNLVARRRQHDNSRNRNAIVMDDGLYKANIELLEILIKANTPLYLFDTINKWAKKAVLEHQVQFSTSAVIPRDKFVSQLKDQFDLSYIEPMIKTVQLSGSGGHQIDVVVHRFDGLLYSILNDAELMQTQNFISSLGILSSRQTILGKSKTLDDIETGSVFINSWNHYSTINVPSGEKNIMCPIIFFIDKTHTDLNGRWCIEQIRFTLGIFNRKTRNSPSAWRTLGYIPDIAHVSTANKAVDKSADYHDIMKVILEDLKRSQKHAVQWDLFYDGSFHTVNFFFPVLFLIGDTEGHDKIAGRYTSRNGIQRLCRYCDCPFKKTDEPEHRCAYNNHAKLFKMVASKNPVQLQQHSMHGIDNAWEDVIFCDQTRGLFGAICADVMHCLQHGLYIYVINMMFDQKQFKVTRDDNGHTDEFNTKCVFSSTYTKEFDGLARRYGKLLLHQSDRDLPRTHFQTNYTSTAKKNASEMTGLLIVFLLVFNADEGAIKLDSTMGKERTTKFMHVIELMLLLDTFCLAPEHRTSMVKKFKLFMPYLLNTVKYTLNRQTGCQMKIIKFHLPNHFGDDMMRFGSMLNFDTGIGESHHKTEAKQPASNTQKRKDKFEFQTATRQVENIIINMAISHIGEPNIEAKEDAGKNSWYRYTYHPELKLCAYNKVDKKRPLEICNWVDDRFQDQLTAICDAVYPNNVSGNFKFFAQLNQGDNIFRADPNFANADAWYDWVEVEWDVGRIPAKLLLFWEIPNHNFHGAFKIGSTHITQAGTYAIAYSLPSQKKFEKAHGASHMVQFGRLHRDKTDKPILCCFPIHSIYGSISAVPYKVTDDIISAVEWLFLRPKKEWYTIFTSLIEQTLSDAQKKQNKNQKRKRE
jgi:hypothetical protein